MGGKNKDEVIMVSIADYDMLIRSGRYEPVEEKKEEIVMKKVYGKKESPYKHSAKESIGPRHRTILGEKEDVMESDDMEWFDPEAVFESDDLCLEPFEETVRIAPTDGNEDGWSF